MISGFFKILGNGYKAVKNSPRLAKAVERGKDIGISLALEASGKEVYRRLQEENPDPQPPRNDQEKLDPQPQRKMK